MKPSPFSPACEKIVADAMRPVASELRLVDAADLIALLKFERHAEIADLVAEAADLFFMPGTVALGTGGDYDLEWHGRPTVALDLEMRPQGATVYLRLTLEDAKGGVEITHIDFDRPSANPAENAAFLAETLARSAFTPVPKAMSA